MQYVAMVIGLVMNTEILHNNNLVLKRESHLTTADLSTVNQLCRVPV